MRLLLLLLPRPLPLLLLLTESRKFNVQCQYNHHTALELI